MSDDQIEITSMDELAQLIEAAVPSSLAARLDRTRPYAGQPHTAEGERGRTLVAGLTMRDVFDCFVRACYDASGLAVKDWPGSVYDLPWDEMDIIAVGQQLSCNIEKYMGIYPNVPNLAPAPPPSDPEYIVVVPHLVGNAVDWETEYSFLRRHRRWPTRDRAIQAGIAELDHDDFLLAVVEGDQVVGIAWQNEDRGTDPEDLKERAEIAQALGLRAGGE